MVSTCNSVTSHSHVFQRVLIRRIPSTPFSYNVQSERVKTVIARTAGLNLNVHNYFPAQTDFEPSRVIHRRFRIKIPPPKPKHSISEIRRKSGAHSSEPYLGRLMSSALHLSFLMI
jgi:hypothetical protein